MSEWCEIFKTGRHKDSKGNEKEWTKDDLEKIKYNFENVNPDVPICVGHPATNAPAYGWWDKLKIEGDKLLVKFKQVQPEFMEACNKGLFKTRSISLTSDLVPRHLAFLGAQAPAIKGMEQFQFEEAADDIKIEFSDSLNALDCAPQEIPLGCRASLAMTGGARNDGKRETYMNFAEENKKLKEQIDKLQKEIKEKDEQKELKEFEDFCDKALSNGNILPCQKDNVVNLFKSLNDKTFNFEDGSEKSSKNVLKEFIEGLKQIDFNEQAPKNNALADDINFNDPNAVKEAILKIQKEHKENGITLSPIEAYQKLKG